VDIIGIATDGKRLFAQVTDSTNFTLFGWSDAQGPDERGNTNRWHKHYIMGIAFILEKAQKFEQRRDAAFEDQLGSENLLSRLPDTSRTTYRCKSVTGECPEVGTPLALYQASDAVNVFVNNQHIGVALSSDAKELKTVMTTLSTEVLAAYVVGVRPETKIFTIQLQIPTP
jgi:hypothetical protein